MTPRDEDDRNTDRIARGVEAMTDEDDTETGPPAHLAGLAGMDLVRRTLEEARGAARIQGKDVGRGRNSPGRRRVAGLDPGEIRRQPTTLGDGEGQPAFDRRRRLVARPRSRPAWRRNRKDNSAILRRCSGDTATPGRS